MNLLRLKEVLKEKGISGKDLAEKVDVSPQTISNIIQGINFPKPELLIKIAEALEVDIRDLFKPTKEDFTEPIFIKREDHYVSIGSLKIPENEG